MITPGNVRTYLRAYVERILAAQGQDTPADLSDDCDLLLSGVLDSLGLLELITAIQEHYGSAIDFEALDPERMTIVGPLCNFVAAQLAEHH
ncbi:MAG: phosphopantetheine-binding protein [Candidatus Binataceae bacterium]